MDNCIYNLDSDFTRFGSNDTTNCQLKINKETINRYNDTLTQKQIYSNIANRRVSNISVCIPEPEEKIVIVTPPPPPPPIDKTKQKEKKTTTETKNSFDNSDLDTKSDKASDLIAEFFFDSFVVTQQVLANTSYPSCSYKPIKF